MKTGCWREKVWAWVQRTVRRWRRKLKAYGRREGRLWVWFGAALAGVLAKGFFEALQAGAGYGLSWSKVVMALVATLVTFEATFEEYEDVPESMPLLVQVSLAFQSGFFWQTVFTDLTLAQG